MPSISEFPSHFIKKNVVRKRPAPRQGTGLSGATYAQQLSIYVSDVVEYIAGFVVKQITKKIDCEICLTAMQSDKIAILIATKDYSNVK